MRCRRPTMEGASQGSTQRRKISILQSREKIASRPRIRCDCLVCSGRIKYGLDFQWSLEFVAVG